MPRTDDELKEAVRDRYARIAKDAAEQSSVDPAITSRAVATMTTGCGCGCSDSPADLDLDSGMKMVEYSGADAEAGVVEGANLGLGCGIPTLFAEITEGMTVLDLGSGAGVDVFMASGAVGPGGHVYGVDMTPEMIALARANAARGGYVNVEFRLGEIEHLPVADGTVDVVISNCVINLVPDKRQAYREIHRVLRPGGSFSISDVVSYGAVPPEVREDLAGYAGCVGGAMDQEGYFQVVREAGFAEVSVMKSQEYDLFADRPYGVRSVTLVGRKAGGRTKGVIPAESTGNPS